MASLLDTIKNAATGGAEETLKKATPPTKAEAEEMTSKAVSSGALGTSTSSGNTMKREGSKMRDAVGTPVNHVNMDYFHEDNDK